MNKCDICGQVGVNSGEVCDTCHRVGCSNCVEPLYSNEEADMLPPNSDAVISGDWLKSECRDCDRVGWQKYYTSSRHASNPSWENKNKLEKLKIKLKKLEISQKPQPQPHLSKKN